MIMKYIEKVILNNFQSHKNTIIEFDNKLNVIIGPSDSGKTAILRGIRWALYNEPSGDYFIREGESDCSVIVFFSDGVKVKRYRSKSKNAYYLYDLDDNETIFEGFGLSVPEEVIEKTGIKKILLDSDLSKSINLSDQLEGPFLLSEKGSTRANSIGRLVGVDIIDDALRESLRDSRNLSNDKRTIDASISQLEEELLEYDYLTELSIKISKFEKMRNEIKDKSESLTKLNYMLGKLTPLQSEKIYLTNYLKSFQQINLLEGLVEKIIANLNSYRYFAKQDNNIKELSKNIAHNIKTTKLLNGVNTIDDKITEITKMYSYQHKLKELYFKSIKHKDEISLLEQESNKLKDISSIESDIKTINEKITRLYNLNLVNKKFTTLRTRLRAGNEYINKLHHTHSLTNLLNKLHFKIEYLAKLDAVFTRYKLTTKDISENKSFLELQNSKVEKQLSNYKELLLKLGTCPLCYSNIDNDKANHIINHFN